MKYGVISLVLCISTRLQLVTILMLRVKYLIIFHTDPYNKSYIYYMDTSPNHITPCSCMCVWGNKAKLLVAGMLIPCGNLVYGMIPDSSQHHSSLVKGQAVLDYIQKESKTAAHYVGIAIAHVRIIFRLFPYTASPNIYKQAYILLLFHLLSFILV